MATSEPSSNVNHNRVLLEGIFLREIDFPDGRKGAAVDGSSLLFVVEELVSLAVTDIALIEAYPAADFVDTLPESLKRRIVIIDKRRKCRSRADAILAPMVEEFQVELDGPALLFRGNLSREVQGSIAVIYFYLYTYLLGLENELQIDINLARFKQSISVLRKASRSPEFRATLAILAGILETYSKRSLTTFELRSTAPDRLVTLFQEFIADETYREMSTHAHFLGFPIHLQRSMTLLGRLAKRLVTKPLFKDLVSLSSKGISTATSLPTPTSEMYETLLKNGYLPPIVSYGGAVQKAREAWALANPDYVPHPLTKLKLVEGFSE
jgi:hypothetical protein